ncbi:GPW/gp25 family protein [Spirosoma taeanense]|uniref:GPW/gp25 family protein n=1 Tax=Spirosoma taeanense TaxID=2735870 RepID=A0A6M5Y3J5_9BACT|nr:GPW/gp25 family protein [Spirosoma taeanense]QJW89137.1 GPW/gp25 family protein [Spirosoma taeanense]
MAELFLGKGWSFPPTFDNRTKEVVMTEGEDDIRGSLEILLGTRIGERIMRPGYGMSLDRLMFEGIDTSLVATLEKDLEFAIALYEPRIKLTELAVMQDRQEAGRLLILVEYVVRSTNTRNNLVYPFYINEGTEK